MARQTPLPHIAILRAAGADARSFIDGQFTNAVAALDKGQTAYGAFCNPKGRAMALARVGATDDGLLLAVDADVADALVATLSRYILRAKVNLAPAADLAAYASGDATDGAFAWPLADDGDGAMTLIAGAPGLADTAPDDADRFALRALRAGLPALAAATAGEFVPQMLNLDLLEGISFTKGCYTGQEIVARTQNLGTIKRRMLRFAADGDAQPAAGAAVHAAGGVTAGKVVTAAASGTGIELLAVVRLSELGGPLTLDDGRTLQRLDLPYAIPELAAP